MLCSGFNGGDVSLCLLNKQTVHQGAQYRTHSSQQGRRPSGSDTHTHILHRHRVAQTKKITQTKRLDAIHMSINSNKMTSQSPFIISFIHAHTFEHTHTLNMLHLTGSYF